MCLWCVENMDFWWYLAKMLLTGALTSCFLGNLLHFALTCTEKYVMAVGRICTVLSVLLTSQMLFPWADFFFFSPQTLQAQTSKWIPTCRISSILCCAKNWPWSEDLQSTDGLMYWHPKCCELSWNWQGMSVYFENRICPSSVCCWSTSAFV